MPEHVSLRRRRVTARQILKALRENKDQVAVEVASSFADLASDEPDAADSIMLAIESHRFMGFFNVMFAVWAARTQQARLRAIGDGQLLETLIELINDFVQNGGLELIVQFITAIIGVFGAQSPRSAGELPSIPN